MPQHYAISDIHGCINTFKTLLSDTMKVTPDDTIYLLGDYIDRGASSKQVLDMLMEMQKSYRHLYILRGNHEQMMLEASRSQRHYINWMMNGGGNTLKSFRLNYMEGIAATKKIPALYLDFIETMPWYLETAEFIFVHAGLNLTIADPFSDKESMLYLRDIPQGDQFLQGRKIIHGHTPQPPEKLKEALLSAERNHYNIDSGCVYDHPGLGYLSALDFNHMKLYSIKRCRE